MNICLNILLNEKETINLLMHIIVIRSVILGGLIMDNIFLIILLFLMTRENQDKHESNISNLENFISSMEVDNKYTLEKVNIVKKVGQYFPEDYIPIINKSISFTEKFIKMNEVMDFIKEDDKIYISEYISVDNNKERISKVISTIQNESPNSGLSKTGTVIDLIINMDKYKKMFGVLNTIMSNPDSLNDPSQLLDLAAPLLVGSNPENNEKIKEMSKMLEIVKLINSPKKETPKDKPNKE